MEPKKPLAILEVSPKGPTKHHLDLFADHPLCDFYYVTHDAPCEGALKFCPKTSWAETRNTLAELVPKQYDYYAFLDYDIVFESQTDKSVVHQLVEDLQEWKPAVLIPYYQFDDKGLTHLGKTPSSHKAFTNNCVKIVHSSLLDWFFPLETKFGGTLD